MIPGEIRKYFWDVDVEKIVPAKSPYFVIARILEYGDNTAARWMLKHFRRSAIEKTLRTTREMTPKSVEYWASVFRLPKNKVRCLKKSYREAHKIRWPY